MAHERARRCPERSGLLLATDAHSSDNTQNETAVKIDSAPMAFVLLDNPFDQRMQHGKFIAITFAANGG